MESFSCAVESSSYAAGSVSCATESFSCTSVWWTVYYSCLFNRGSMFGLGVSLWSAGTGSGFQVLAVGRWCVWWPARATYGYLAFTKPNLPWNSAYGLYWTNKCPLWMCSTQVGRKRTDWAVDTVADQTRGAPGAPQWLAGRSKWAPWAFVLRGTLFCYRPKLQLCLC